MDLFNNWFKYINTNSKFYKLTKKKFKDVKHLKNYCDLYKNINNGVKYTNTESYRRVICNIIFIENERMNYNEIIYYNNDKKKDLVKLEKFGPVYKDIDTNEYYYSETRFYYNTNIYGYSKLETKFYKCKYDILEGKYLLLNDILNRNHKQLLNSQNNKICDRIFNINEYIDKKLKATIFKIIKKIKNDCLFVNKLTALINNEMIKSINFNYDVEKILNLLKDTIICYYNIHESGIFKKIDSVDGLNHKEAIYYDNKEQDIEELLADYAQEIVTDIFKEDIETKKAPSLINTTPKIKNKVAGTKEKEDTQQPTAPPSIPDPTSHISNSSYVTNQPNTLLL